MGRNIALVVTALLFWVGVRVHTWWREKHSPTAIEGPADGVNPQDNGDVTPVDPTSDPSAGKRSGSKVVELERWLGERDGTAGTNALLREAARRFKVSPSTVKRRLRRIRDRGES